MGSNADDLNDLAAADTSMEEELYSLPYLVEQMYDSQDADFMIFAEPKAGRRTVYLIHRHCSWGGNSEHGAYHTAFKVHKARLAAMSQVFKDMFDVCTPEAGGSSLLPRVRLVENVDTVKILLGHVYADGERVITLNSLPLNILSDVTAAAHKYELPGLLSHVTDILMLRPIQIPKESAAAMSVFRTATTGFTVDDSLASNIMDKLALAPSSAVFSKSELETDCSGYVRHAQKRDALLKTTLERMIQQLLKDKDLMRRDALVAALENFCDAFALRDLISPLTLEKRKEAADNLASRTRCGNESRMNGDWPNSHYRIVTEGTSTDPKQSLLWRPTSTYTRTLSSEGFDGDTLYFNTVLCRFKKAIPAETTHALEVGSSSTWI